MNHDLEFMLADRRYYGSLTATDTANRHPIDCETATNIVGDLRIRWLRARILERATSSRSLMAERRQIIPPLIEIT